MSLLNPKSWKESIGDWLIERKIKRSFRLREDIRGNNPAANVPVEITRGIYKGLVYEYGAAKFQEGNVAYQYSVHNNGHLIDEEFKQFAGQIMMYLIKQKGYYDIITRNDGSY